MKITKVWAVYFSPTGNTKKVITTMAKKAAEVLSVPMETFDFTLPENREGVTSFESEDLVFFSTPVYAGRIPNKMLPYVQSAFEGNGAFAVPVSVFGNRNFDNGLIELRNELELHGFHTIAAAGIPTEHVFSNKLATGRPDADDLAKIAEFGEKVAKKVADMTEIPAKIEVRGDDPVTAYYTPLGTKDAPDTCTGICIKCHACIKACPAGAKYFDDEAFLSHVEMLKQNYQRRAEAEWFI